MTIEEVVRQVLREDHGDVIRESVRVVAQELMEAEVCELRTAADTSRIVVDADPARGAAHRPS